VTTTTIRTRAELDADNDVLGARPDIDFSFDPNRSTTLLLMNEALARVRTRMVGQRRNLAAQRPAREVAVAAAKRRELF
jgi:hypothetical protein